MKSSATSKQLFVSYLEKSHLFTPEDLTRLLQPYTGVKTAEGLAAELVKSGKLTKFQGDCLLAGKYSNLVIDQYLIQKLLGKGGLGHVYKALHKTMNRTVALKVLAPHLMNTEKAQNLFHREVLAAARLIHANIATAYDACANGQRYYLVMEYVDGPNLEQLVRKLGPLKPFVACEIIRQAALGLQHAHEMGMLHRDIKPANILIHRSTLTGQPWLVKIVDFGLARLHAPDDSGTPGPGTILAKQNTVMGTPDYLSPEQSKNLHEVDIRSDLYSLGCTFYFLLTGKVPFPGGTALEKVIRHCNAKPRPIDYFRKDVPEPFLQVLEKLIAKDPADRFQNPKEAIAHLLPLTSSNLSGKMRRPISSASMSPSQKIPPSSFAEDSEKGIAVDQNASPLVGTWPGDLSPTPMPSEELKTTFIGKVSKHLPISFPLLLILGLLMLLVAVISYFIFRS
ncbi:MAG: serine/threonine protein kinase [Bdellovibrionales bacterium]